PLAVALLVTPCGRLARHPLRSPCSSPLAVALPFPHPHPDRQSFTIPALSPYYLLDVIARLH
ncbi:MAG TPA: hypothetical protein VFQ36_01570, partial [Ktedonobacteraceae bacterium]|nr:hypothetical protein [Ktedonobacteraceae bacterium]